MINKLWVNCVNGIRVGHELLNVGVENILVGNGMEAQWGYEKYKQKYSGRTISAQCPKNEMVKMKHNFLNKFRVSQITVWEVKDHAMN